MAITVGELRALDAADPLGGFRERFELPDGLAYLAGNSLGPPPRAAAGRMDEVVRNEWGRLIVRGWFDADWIGAPQRVGDKIGRLIGASPGETVAADSTSVDLYKLMLAALETQPGDLLVPEDEFPTLVYVAEAVARLAGRTLRRASRNGLAATLGHGVGLLALSNAHYRTSEVWDMAAVNAAARGAGALALWDLSHGAGVLDIDVKASGTELAVGCGYKYLNGGPGAPAWLFVANALQGRLRNPIPGWMGHAAPFDFAPRYRPAEGVNRFLAGTPPILSLLALETAIDVQLQADPKACTAKATRLGEVMLELMAEHCPELEPVCPGPGQPRGGHVGFRHPEAAALAETLTKLGVIGDVRPPDVLRFGLSPLYVRFEDVGRAVQALRQALG